MDLEKIIEIVNKLSSKKSPKRNSVISSSNFTSIAYDRFISDISKYGLTWNGDSISIENLINSKNEKYDEEKTHLNLNHQTVNSEQLGIGIDIQSIKDFPETEDFWKNEFYTSRFSKKEISYAIKRKNPIETFSGIFAAKEAVFKATGVDLSKIEIFWKNGKPSSHFANLSISHDRQVAISVAIDQNFKITENKLDSESLDKNADDSVNNIHEPKKQKKHNLNLFSKIHFLITLLILSILIYFWYIQI